MKRLILNKLLILSHSQSKSIEVPFCEGLNIIVGGNKTGKSSLIKSVFDCFGCKTKIESRWKDVVTAAAVIFSYGDAQYCLVKRDTIRDLYAFADDDWQCVVTTSDFDAFNKAFILSTLELLSDKSGQFIICTERDTGYEEKAANVFRLTKQRECLSDTQYEEHAALFNHLLEICLNTQVTDAQETALQTE